ncbi:MAG: hypothetical protein NZ656_03900 [Nitrospinaceae bacterium]|nr:hypothetical protein [Nitrospinaceae bacterium]
MKQLVGIITIFVLGVVDLQAAKVPMSQKELEKQSNHIVSGKVISVIVKVQKSKIERALGLHRDKVYTIKLKVASVLKGAGVKVGQEILIEAWQPSTRIPPLPGLQGHEPVSAKGDTVKMYLLKNKKAKAYQPLLPNGIEITKIAKKSK